MPGVPIGVGEVPVDPQASLSAALRLQVDIGVMPVSPSTNANQDPAYVAPESTVAVSKGLMALGWTNDATPAAEEIPLGPDGRSIIAEPALYVPNYQTAANNVVNSQRGIDGTIGQAVYPFKTVSTAATGSTALWTPGGSRKFRLMRYMLVITSNAASAGGVVIVVDLLDGATTMGQTHSVFVPAVAITTGGAPIYITPWIDLGNGILSSTGANVLNVNLSAALTSGVVRVIACGCEE